MPKKNKTYRIYTCKNGSQIISPVKCGCETSAPTKAKTKTTPKSAPRAAKPKSVKRTTNAQKSTATQKAALKSTRTKYKIEKLNRPVNGYHYQVQVLRSVDGGKRYYYCGEGKYVKTYAEAQDYVWQCKQSKKSK